MRIVRGAAGDDVRVVELGPRLDPQPVLMGDIGEEAADQARDEAAARGEHVEAEHHHGPVDPHVWLDPQRMQTACDLFATELARLDPAHAQGFRDRATTTKAALAALDARIAARRATWTKDTIVTFHGSMGYYARRYRLRIAAVVEPFPGREPTPRYMTEVLAAIGAAHPAALFSEPQLDPRPARVIAQQSGVPLFETDPVGGTAETNTYEKLLTHDTDVLERALR
jgi:zinc transport system substrate-binding protein